MNKYILPFILIAVCLLPACRDDFNEPDSIPAEAISLSVSDAGFASSKGKLSRSYDNGGTTVFEAGDTVGLIILDAGDHILANNVPYIYDGSKWDFCTGNTEGKQRVYFDKEMTKYIVYYPYTKTADNTKSREDLMKLEAFKWKDIQNTKQAFRQADVMIWTHEDGPLKEIKADMKHVRNSLSLDLKVRYTLTLKDDNGKPVVITYHPKRMDDNKISSSFEDFTIYMDDEMILDKTYNAQDCGSLETLSNEDGSYRYILPDTCSSTFTWRYYYSNGKTYAGKLQADKTDEGTRYYHEEILDMGKLIDNKISPGDFYCTKTVNDTLTGYVLPQNALEFLLESNCIAIVYVVGQHESDKPEPDGLGYPKEIYKDIDSSKIGKCQGYAVSLTNATHETSKWCSSTVHEIPMGTASNEWNGYQSFLTIKESRWYKLGAGNFPPVKNCDEYGKIEPLMSLAAPVNSSGWYLPTASQGIRIGNVYPLLDGSFKCVEARNKINTYIDPAYEIRYTANQSTIYWSSTESVPQDGKSVNAIYFAGNGSSSRVDKSTDNYKYGTRAILSF